MISFIDTHCHLYAEELNDDLDLILQKIQENKISKIYLPAIDSSVIQAMLEFERNYPELCFPMMGIHPVYVKENYQEELRIVKEWIDKREFAAMGEIGLDSYWDTTFKYQQIEAFEIQMQWALEKNWPIVIHSRNAMDETIEMVKPFAEKGLKGIFHCFSGTLEQAEQIIHMHFLLGIGGVVTYKKVGLAEVVEKIDLKHIVLETDAPYLAPVPFRGKRNEPAYLVEIAKKIASIKNVSLAQVASITSENAKKIFNTI